MKYASIALAMILLTGCSMTPKQELSDYSAHSNALTGVTMCGEEGHVTKAQSEELTQIMYQRLSQSHTYNSQKMSTAYDSRLEELKMELANADDDGLAFFKKVCGQIPSMLAYNREGNEIIKFPKFD